MLYEFTTIEEFVRWFELQAKVARNKAETASRRTHSYVCYIKEAETIDRICCVVRNSNLTVLSHSDLKKIATHT